MIHYRATSESDVPGSPQSQRIQFNRILTESNYTEMRTQDPHVWSEVGNKSLAAIELCEELGSNEAAWEKEIISLDGRWLQKTDIRGFLVALTDSIRTYAEPFGLPEVAKRWAAELNVDPGSSPDKLPN